MNRADLILVGLIGLVDLDRLLGPDFGRHERPPADNSNDTQRKNRSQHECSGLFVKAVGTQP